MDPLLWTLSEITSQNKNGGDRWGLCTEILWRGYRFAMNGIKKSKNISGEAYIQSSNANARVLLNLSIFLGWFLLFLFCDVISDKVYCAWVPP